MKDEIITQCERIYREGEEEIKRVKSKEELEKWRVKYLGRKSELNAIFSKIPQLPSESKPVVGRKLNEIKTKLKNIFEEKKEKIEEIISTFNLSFPGKTPEIGSYHPITLTIRKMSSIFIKMGFGIATGPEIETDYYNFEALNTPPDHPAKDIWDTFYISEKEKILLRTHTSPVQIRVMEKIKPPLRIIAVGKCFRRDAFDASHSPVFHQMEGLMVDKGINFAHLKGTLVYFLTEFFGKDIKIKFSPSYFPFTEPSAEVSISCVICGGKGCSTCGNTGYLEILGCGMVHPQVFRNVGYNPDEWTGFAFGMGIERIAMLKYRISDIRYFYQNDIRFLKQLG